MKKLEAFLKPKLKEVPDIRSGDTVRVHEKIKEGKRERIQVFEGLVLARKHGREAGATITVRRIMDGVGVEKTFPLHCPAIEKIEIKKRAKTRRAKLYYLRGAKGKRARLKRKEIKEAMGVQEEIEELPKLSEEKIPKKEIEEESKKR